MQLSDIDDPASHGNVATLFDRTVEHHGEATAIQTDERELSHAELRDATAAFAGGLRDRGVEPDETLLLYLPNCPEYLIATLGAFRAGVPVSPVNPQYKARELGYQLDDTGASVVVTHPALAPVVAETLADTEADPLVVLVGGSDAEGELDDAVAFEAVTGEPTTVDRAADDVALLPYTSGTTGRPKGVELTHRNFRSQLVTMLVGETAELESDEAIDALLYLPLYHITGFTHTAMQPLVRGGTVSLRNPTDWDAADAMATIEERGITHFVGVTAMYVDLVNDESFGEYDLTSLVTAGEGGAKMSVAVQHEFEDVAGVEMTEAYGLTETNGMTHSQGESTFGLRHGTIGQPIRMVDCRIVDEEGEEVPIGETGELLVRGPQVMAGYHNMPEATDAAFTEHGYFRTGDVARRDADNYYEIVDRKKHVIVSAGYNVYPSEVEEVLREHEAVADAAVVGVPDERRNEVPVAYVVPRETDPTDELAEEVRAFCLDAIAEYKHPREVQFIDELPRTTSGKVRKFKLEARYDEAEGADAGTAGTDD